MHGNAQEWLLGLIFSPRLPVPTVHYRVMNMSFCINGDTCNFFPGPSIHMKYTVLQDIVTGNFFWYLCDCIYICSNWVHRRYSKYYHSCNMQQFFVLNVHFITSFSMDVTILFNIVEADHPDDIVKVSNKRCQFMLWACRLHFWCDCTCFCCIATSNQFYIMEVCMNSLMKLCLQYHTFHL